GDGAVVPVLFFEGEGVVFAGAGAFVVLELVDFGDFEGGVGRGGRGGFGGKGAGGGLGAGGGGGRGGGEGGGGPDGGCLGGRGGRGVNAGRNGAGGEDMECGLRIRDPQAAGRGGRMRRQGPSTAPR